MIPYEENLDHLRHKMVDDQLRARDIGDERVLDVFRKVPRHRFVDPSMKMEAYGDFPLSIGKGQTISQPYMVALMVQVAGVKENNRVLEIGTGSGYETAVLAELAREVFSIERVEALAVKAQGVLRESGYQNIKIKVDDGTVGWEEFSPFDRIIVTASSPEAPRPLLDQLAIGGRMVIPVGPRFNQSLVLFERSKKRISEKHLAGCVFVPLIGKYGWKDTD